MKNCPKCASTNFCKDGIVKGKQRYLCKQCKYRFTVETIGKPNKVKRDALLLYLEGLGFRSIGRFLNVSHVSVYKWIKSSGESIDEIRSSSELTVVEIDEMHTYIGTKKTTRGFGLLLIELGENSSTAKLVVEQQKQGNNFGEKLAKE
jgi:Transposase and inactivated derivatives